MKRSLTFYTEVDWQDNWGKGDGWTFNTYFPPLYVNKEHAKNNNLKEWRKTKDKDEFWKTFKKIKITIEDIGVRPVDSLEK